MYGKKGNKLIRLRRAVKMGKPKWGWSEGAATLRQRVGLF